MAGWLGWGGVAWGGRGRRGPVARPPAAARHGALRRQAGSPRATPALCAHRRERSPACRCTHSKDKCLDDKTACQNGYTLVCNKGQTCSGKGKCGDTPIVGNLCKARGARARVGAVGARMQGPRRLGDQGARQPAWSLG